MKDTSDRPFASELDEYPPEPISVALSDLPAKRQRGDILSKRKLDQVERFCQC
jgi:hypothetical protein